MSETQGGRTISQETRRHWLNAYLLEDWRRRVGPALRKSYKANDDDLTRATYVEARDWLQGWVASIDSTMAEAASLSGRQE